MVATRTRLRDWRVGEGGATRGDDAEARIDDLGSEADGGLRTPPAVGERCGIRKVWSVMVRSPLLILTAVVFGLYALWELTFPSGDLRYRLTLVAEVDGREVSGSGVVDTHWRNAGPLYGVISNLWDGSYRGQATVLDLGERGRLFVLFRRDPYRSPDRYRSPSGSLGGPSELVWRVIYAAFPEEMTGNSKWIVWRAAVTKPSVSIGIDELPLVVRFRDPSDPATVERVDPRDLAATLGPGVALKRVTVEFVSRGWFPFDLIGWPPVLAGVPVSDDLLKVIPWLGDNERVGGGLIPQSIQDQRHWRGLEDELARRDVLDLEQTLKLRGAK